MRRGSDDALQTLLGSSTPPAPRPTADGGYLLLGNSRSSGNGDVTGSNHGGVYKGDIWVVKTDDAGTILWQKLLGGDKDEIGYSVEPTADGGCVLVGSSSSSANGDVTGIRPALKRIEREVPVSLAKE